MVEQAQRGEQWSIYNRIKDPRRSREITQKELARDLELNVRTVGYIERQDYEPNLRLAWRAADYFGVELEDVFYRAEHPGKAEESPHRRHQAPRMNQTKRGAGFESGAAP